MRLALRLSSLLLAALFVRVPAAAQVTASPAALEVAVPAGQAAEVALTVSNGGAEVHPLALALVPAGALDDGTEPGDTLFTTPEWYYQLGDLTVLPSGRVLVADSFRDFYEFTSDLSFVRTFEHPTTAFLSSTVGLAHSPDTGPGGPDGEGGSLWWMDIQVAQGGEITQALLLEGDLDGDATGRTLPLTWSDGSHCGFSTGAVYSLGYDHDASGAGRFYYLDPKNDTVWAMDTLGAVAAGYPAPMSDYLTEEEPCSIGLGLDAHTLSGGEGPGGDPLPAEPLFEVLHAYPGEHPNNRVTRAVVLDREGRNRGAETPLVDLSTPDGFGTVRAIWGLVRSRLDPSVLYVTVTTGSGGTSNRDWVYAVRAAPLPPVWLRAEEILFEVEPESERELTLVLDATGLEPGVYEAVVAVRAGDGIGPVVAEVPITLTVTPATDAEGDPGGEAEPVEGPALSVYPNPSVGNGVVSLALARTAEVRVEVFDVLGREVVVLHDGPLVAGAHRLALDATDLPAGLYLVRATGDNVRAVQRVTVVR